MMKTSMNLQSYVNQIFVTVTEFYHNSKKAENRPEFMLHYYGHVNIFEILIYPEGWTSKNSPIRYEIDFDKDFDTNAVTLNYILNHVMLVISKWKEESA